TIKTKVGTASLTVGKKYYHSTSAQILVPLQQKQSPFQVAVLATGRQVPLVVTDKISGKPVPDVTISAAGTEAKTGKDGKVTIVLPADKAEVGATLSAKGFNDSSATIKVSQQAVPQNSFQLTKS